MDLRGAGNPLDIRHHRLRILAHHLEHSLLRICS